MLKFSGLFCVFACVALGASACATSSSQAPSSAPTTKTKTSSAKAESSAPYMMFRVEVAREGNVVANPEIKAQSGHSFSLAVSEKRRFRADKQVFIEVSSNLDGERVRLRGAVSDPDTNRSMLSIDDTIALGESFSKAFEADGVAYRLTIVPSKA